MMSNSNWQHRTELSTHDGCLLWGHCVFVPPQGRTVVLQKLNGGHLGVTQMKRLAHGVVWWPEVDDEIDCSVHSCSKYQVQQDM